MLIYFSFVFRTEQRGSFLLVRIGSLSPSPSPSPPSPLAGAADIHQTSFSGQEKVSGFPLSSPAETFPAARTKRTRGSGLALPCQARAWLRFKAWYSRPWPAGTFLRPGVLLVPFTSVPTTWNSSPIG